MLQGFGGGMILPVGQAILAQAAGPQRMGRVMSVIGVPTLLGPILGPVIGGLIVDHFSWRWIFFVSVPVRQRSSWRWPARILPAAERGRARAQLDVRGLLLTVARARRCSSTGCRSSAIAGRRSDSAASWSAGGRRASLLVARSRLHALRAPSAR